ncbi:hypothetical protein FDG2_0568 [Candidatus Protofrankia californiensis]|uniref:Uncharacterized protein n=1 Tax=Candidatus Protofrankia californiensis TaxID=1839754 RepID=A0A1C3NTS6_9ACTN|nr:hypothetical protein FDG2_0568 [Candidatus Protofrankia californiensis]
MSVDKGPVTGQRAVCRYRTERCLAAPAHAALAFISHRYPILLRLKSLRPGDGALHGVCHRLMVAIPPR